MKWLGVGVLLAVMGISPAIAQKAPVPETPFLRLDVGMHTAPIKRMATDATGTLLATASDDKTVGLWSLPDGNLLHTFRVPIADGREGRVYSTALSPDGSTLLAAGHTGEAWDGAFAIYFFDVAKRRLVARLPNLPAVITHLAFSPDGKRFAAALGGTGAVGMWNAADGKPVGSDGKYAGRAMYVTFAPNGDLVTLAEDGFIRLYDPAMAIKGKLKGSGKTPYSAAVSPDGGELAVGYLDKLAVDVFSLKDLRLQRSLDVKGLRGENLAAVAWAGGEVVAGGMAEDAKGDIVVRRWNKAGKPYSDVGVSRDAINHLVAGRNGAVLFASSEPSWGEVTASGRLGLVKRSGIADFRGVYRGRLAVSADGQIVEFGTRKGGDQPLRFDIRQQRLAAARSADGALTRPLVDGLPVTNWSYSADPRFAGRSLALGQGEMALSLAMTPDRKRFLLGADYTLRLYDANGSERKAQPVPGAAWGVAVSGDGSVAVAALGDGTLRWYSLRPGEELTELAALFVMPGTERWVAWTAEGLFAHSENGGKEMVGYHFNQGKAKSPEWVDFAQLYRLFYAPELLPGKITGRAEAKIRQRIAANGDVGTRFRNAAPPKVEITEYCFAEAPGGVETCRPADSFSVTRALARTTPAGGTSAGGVVRLPAGVDNVRLRYKLVERGGGIGEIDAIVNGVNVGRDVTRGLKRTGGPAADAVTEKVVRLAAGKNDVKLRAWDAANDTSEESNALAFEVEARRELKAETAKPRLFVIAIAVDKYRGDVQHLGFPVKDARSFVQEAKTSGARFYDSVTTIELYDEQVTSGNIAAKVAEIKGKLREQDAVVLYFAGHGIVLNENKASYYFVTQAVTKFEEIEKLGLGDRELVRLIAELQPSQVMTILDTCHSGSFNIASIGEVKNGSGQSVLAASLSKQEALDSYDSRNGLMMRAIIEAFSGKAYENADGNQLPATTKEGAITSRTLGLFVMGRVPALATHKGHEQSARFEPSEKPFVIGKVK